MATFTVTENFGTYQGNTSYILDGNTSNCWQANDAQASGKYVLLTASERVHVNSVQYYTSNSSEYFRTGAYLQTSDDGTNFTDVGQFSGSKSQTFTVNADCKYIRIYCKSGGDSQYVSISELTIDYTEISTVTHTVTVQAENGAEADKAGENTVQEGNSFELTINGAVNTITDNGVDVKSQLVEHQPQSGGEVTKYPAAYTTTGTIKGTNYKNCIGKGSSNTASGNDYSSSNNSTATISYTFDFSGIPSNATIDSVSVAVGGHAENASRSTADLQLYSGSTAKGGQSKFTSTSKQVITMTPGTWTRAELQSAKLTFTIGYYGGLVNGVDWTVVYSVPGSGGVYYTYTISSVSEDHTILINVGAVPEDAWIKLNGSQAAITICWKKVNGQWVEQSDKGRSAFAGLQSGAKTSLVYGGETT